MLVKILSIVHNDKLHLFELLDSVGVACHRTAILTLAYFEGKFSVVVMAVIIIATERDVFALLNGVGLIVVHATPNELI